MSKGQANCTERLKLPQAEEIGEPNVEYDEAPWEVEKKLAEADDSSDEDDDLSLNERRIKRQRAGAI